MADTVSRGERQRESDKRSYLPENQWCGKMYIVKLLPRNSRCIQKFTNEETSKKSTGDLKT